MRSTFLLVLSVLLTAASVMAMQDSGQREELVTVSLRGTTIDVVPNDVYIVTKNIEGASIRLAERGAERFKLIKNGKEVPEIGFLYKGILHVLVCPADVNSEIGSFAFDEGDTIYVFTVDSEQHKKRFIERYKLTKQSDIVLSGRYKRELFKASKGHFVRFLEPTTIYRCLMHPDIDKDSPGKCPTCKMTLQKLQVDR